MSRITIGVVVALALCTPALAHPGHLATVGGHTHWIATAAFVLAGVVAGGAVLAHRAAARRGRAAARKR